MNSFISVKYNEYSGDYMILSTDEGDIISARNLEKCEKSYHVFHGDSILFDFLSVDISLQEQILGFCQKYGLLYDSDGWGSPTGEMSIKSFQRSVSVCRVILDVNDAFRRKSLCDISRAVSKLIYLYYERVGIPSEFISIVQPFIQAFPKSHTRRVDKPNIKEVFPKYVHNHDYTHSSKLPTISYDVISDCLELSFSLERCLSHLSPEIAEDIFVCAMKGCAAILNSKLCKVNIESEFFAGKLTDRWVAPNLISIVFYELNHRLAGGEAIRRCASKTCGDYFRIYGNDTRKIYCSTRCAQLEAKRKQRERQKSKEVL